ncbi:hypothetical protein SARC_12934 [Sphaeroforma arctica JP610]|uniref:Uncharacterized protein n=1 Tax=Sphaeroforma arctica JP610 TaxID=667725 RepID=A0A0L0FCP5_9EUKA|nr:hypothetical protein SARC_12934 [Sphaeroforma arctica JP610]KNC74524.1 hypothetical protein SARC_12934 [Sphaeroforma arctica JP610]|eukprot:XP_014148426.1 hypothetical protein SARC_12934 [Sphaeroforma arctica JP610]
MGRMARVLTKTKSKGKSAIYSATGGQWITYVALLSAAVMFLVWHTQQAGTSQGYRNTHIPREQKQTQDIKADDSASNSTHSYRVGEAPLSAGRRRPVLVYLFVIPT